MPDIEDADIRSSDEGAHNDDALVPIPEEMQAALNELPPEQRNAFQLIYQEIRRFSGPLPPPDMLAEYEQAFPGCAREIVEMSKQEQAFDHRMSEKVVDASIAIDVRGMQNGTYLTGLMLIGAFVLILAGRDVLGVVAFVTAAGNLIGGFIYSERKKAQVQKQVESQSRPAVPPGTPNRE